jgi:transposase
VLVELSVVEQRYQAVMEFLSDRLTVTEVAERFGVSRQIVHRWIRRYEGSGLNGLADRSHRPESCAHQIGAEVESLKGATETGFIELDPDPASPIGVHARDRHPSGR